MSEKQRSGEMLSVLSRDITGLAESSAKGVVALNTRGEYPTTGTVWENGYIVTADHVLHAEEGIIATFDDGREHSAEVVGRDPGADIALLKADTGDVAFTETLQAADIRPGTLALALSRNSEKSLNASLAVVNAVGGEWRSRNGSPIDNFIRLDVRTHAGFSGGPLVDSEGALIGIDSARLSRQSPVALPVSTVARVVAELKEHGRVRRGYLGVATFPIGLDEPLRTRLGIEQEGALVVVQVEEESGAHKGGILQGDLLLEIGGTRLRDPEELQGALGPETVGTAVVVKVVRGGALEELRVEVGDRPAPSGSWHRGWQAHRHWRHGGR